MDGSAGVVDPLEGSAAEDSSAAIERQFLPGLYFDIPEDTYHASPGVSVSALKRFHEAPAKVKVRRPDTKSLAFGSLAHTAVLQPHLLADRYHVVDLPRISAREKATKDAMAAAGARELLRNWLDGLPAIPPPEDTPNPFGMDDNPAEICTELRQVVKRCRDQFLSYETQHRAKGTPEADAKADVNRDLAALCAAVLAGD